MGAPRRGARQQSGGCWPADPGCSEAVAGDEARVEPGVEVVIMVAGGRQSTTLFYSARGRRGAPRNSRHTRAKTEAAVALPQGRASLIMLLGADRHNQGRCPVSGMPQPSATRCGKFDHHCLACALSPARRFEPRRYRGRGREGGGGARLWSLWGNALADVSTSRLSLSFSPHSLPRPNLSPCPSGVC